MTPLRVLDLFSAILAALADTPIEGENR